MKSSNISEVYKSIRIYFDRYCNYRRILLVKSEQTKYFRFMMYITNFLVLYLLMNVVGCSHFDKTHEVSHELEKDGHIHDKTQQSERNNGLLPSDEYLANIYPNNKHELRKLVFYKDKIIDSLHTKIDYLYFRVDSLHQELIYYDGRITVQPDFEIPREFEFAGRTFCLRNERVYHMFSEIFDNELKAAHRYIPLSGMYFPLFESVLAEHGIPEDIKYLAIAESSLASMATSPVGAGGIWQFMPATARSYGLRIDSFIDERRNIYKATEAAARYLNNSYRRLTNLGSGDWLLAMCAYNAGDASIARVMREQQAHDFFDLIMRVDETNRYVWRSAAIKLIFEHEKKLFGEYFKREPSLLDITRKESIALNGHHKIDDWVKAQGTVLRRVWELNPWINIYQRQRRRYSPINDIVLPAGEYEILLPIDSVPDPALVARAKEAFQDRNAGYYTHHIVRRGDTLHEIAKRYGVTVASIQSANNLRSNIIHPGQRLQVRGTTVRTSSSKSISEDIYTVRSGDTLSEIASRSGTTVAMIQSLNSLNSTIIRPGQTLRLRSTTSSVSESYKVKRGDTLSAIAHRFNTTINELMSLNNLNSTTIREGQNLSVPGIIENNKVYVVQTGDSVEIIARRLNVSQNHLISQNNLTVQQKGSRRIVIIQPGQKLHY